MLKAIVNQQPFELSIADDGGLQVTLNGQNTPADLVQLGEGRYHLIANHQSYTVLLKKHIREEKTLELDIQGNRAVVVLRDGMDLLLEKMGLGNAMASAVNDLKAPMPGMVLKVEVEVGQAVNKGDALCVLEAMKMENVLKATAAATVKAIRVKAGDSVDKNQILIEF
jgi:biotin carboxyl carrier protein